MKKRAIKLITTVAILAMLAACGGSSGGSTPPPPLGPIKDKGPITCPGCLAPPDGMQIWSINTGDPFSVHLLIEGQTCLDNEAWLAAATKVQIRFRQIDPATGNAKVTGAWDHLGIKTGCYAGIYSTFNDNPQFCPGETWCSDPGAWIELYVNDGVTQFHVFAIPGKPYKGAP